MINLNIDNNQLLTLIVLVLEKEATRKWALSRFIQADCPYELPHRSNLEHSEHAVVIVALYVFFYSEYEESRSECFFFKIESFQISNRTRYDNEATTCYCHSGIVIIDREGGGRRGRGRERAMRRQCQ